jgi:hypothetical protein
MNDPPQTPATKEKLLLTRCAVTLRLDDFSLLRNDFLLLLSSARLPRDFKKSFGSAMMRR